MKKKKNQVKERYKYTEDDAYLYANASGDSGIGLVIVLATICIIGFILCNIIF